MNYDWPTFFASIGGSAGVMAVSFFIVKNWLKKKIEADVQHKYNSMLEDIKTENAKELEGFKAGYQKVLDENQIRFSKWHDAQADAIKELYKKLTQMKIALRHMVNPLKFFPPGVDSKEQIKKEEELFLELHESSHRFYEENKILIPEKYICKLEKLYKEVLSSMRSYGKSKNAGAKSSFEFAEQASDFAKSMEIILDDLRKDFRVILNGEEVQDAE